jgi:hypothetical protein
VHILDRLVIPSLSAFKCDGSESLIEMEAASKVVALNLFASIFV